MQAIGRFDPRCGGQLVIDEIKKVLEFPAGSLPLPRRPIATSLCATARFACNLPSTAPVGYSASSTTYFEEALRTQDPVAHQEMLEMKKMRWKMGVSLWSRLEGLVAAVIGE